MNITIRDLDERVYRRFKAKAVGEGIKLGDAVAQAMTLWISETGDRPRSRLSEIPSFNWGKGTERSSEEIDGVLYGGKR